MSHAFDKQYWDDIWSSDRVGTMGNSDPNPHLQKEVAALRPGSALDAGCGAGAEAIWLTSAGWAVTAVDVAAEALTLAERRAAAAGLPNRVHWVQADLSTWEPDHTYDLVTTHYAHPAVPQLEFYRRIATWVAPGGTLLIVGHLHDHHSSGGHDHGAGDHGRTPLSPAEASVTAAAVTALLDPDVWEIQTAEESQRTVPGSWDRAATLLDVVVRAIRRRN